MPKGALVIAALLVAMGVAGLVRSMSSDDPTEAQDDVAESLEFLPDIQGDIPRAQTFENMDEFVAGLEDHGLECTELQDMGTTGHPTLLAFHICDVGTPANRFDLYLYKSKAARDRWFGSRMDSGLPWIYGPNWIVVVAGEPATASQRVDLIRHAIGGRVGPT